jgi:enoyl-CoA hydratase/carnithine racemase
MSTEGGADVVVERDGTIAVVWLNRPLSRNAYTPSMGQLLKESLIELDRDDAVRAIVVAGKGEHFGVGADLTIDWRDPLAHAVELLTEPESAPWKMATPIVVAINGDAIGVSLTWAIQCDVRVVADDARLAFSFNRIGIMPDRNSLWLLPRLIGAGAAMDLLLTGRTIDGVEAHRMGLASRITSRSEVVPLARSIARDIATQCAPASVTATKELFYQFLEETDRIRAYNTERRVLTWIRTLGETLKGIEAFRSKSTPQWGTKKSDHFPRDLW